MKHTPRLIFVLLLWILSACAPSAPTEGAVPPAGESTAIPSATPSEEVETATSTPSPRPSPTPTTPPLQLEVVLSQTWTDKQGNARTQVLVRNPYDFPVQPGAGARAILYNRAGDVLQDQELYFLDGVTGGNGYLLPGETIAADACFTCEQALLTEEWDRVEYLLYPADASGVMNISTEVSVQAASVSFRGDDLFFDVSGTVTNNSSAAIDRISVRFIVFDSAGSLVGAAEASAWEVAAGATVRFSGYGIGQAPSSPVEYEVSALGVTY